jgi:hypothetical protein
MALNAMVSWLEPPRPWEAEEALIRSVSLPLNLQGNQHRSFHSRLTAIRAAAKERHAFFQRPVGEAAVRARCL